MKHYTPYNKETGLFQNSTITCPGSSVGSLILPDGVDLMEGRFSHLHYKVDPETLEIVRHQPTGPDPDEWRSWEWNEQQWRWLSVPTNAALARDIRAEREKLLAACDWTQLPDVPAGTAADWATYRQALRDISDQSSFPGAIDWPTPPSLTTDPASG